ncbi:MAG: EamA family transporter [Actinomycetota bacterium]
MRDVTRAGTAEPPSWLVWAALWTVYIVWGSTYLAIRVTVETMPPLLTASVRFLVAGTAVYVFLWLRKGRSFVHLEPREMVASTLVGALLLFGGNGIVSVAEEHVPSALAALIIASVPLWIVVLRFITGDRVPGGTMAGVAVGFAGVALLIVPGDQPGTASLGHLLLIVAASMSWATGSFISKRLPLPKDPFVSTAAQMLGGGVVLAVAGVIGGEASNLDVSTFSGASIAGLVYLIVAGSLLAFTAYVWLLQNAPISKVSTYAYVNPVVAIFLGWLILSEEVTPVIIAGAAVIVAAVAWIVRMEAKIDGRERRAAAELAASEDRSVDVGETAEAGGAPPPHVPQPTERLAAQPD